MSLWAEILLDLIALVLISAGVWLLYEPAGLIVAGIGVAWLSLGLKQRATNGARTVERSRLKAYEREDQ